MTTSAAARPNQGDPIVPTIIPLPSDFPVTWERPADAQLLWLRQRMHFPEPMKPLDEWLLRTEFEGVARIAQYYDLPLYSQGRRINTYAYATLTSLDLPPAELAVYGQRAQAKLGAAMAQLMTTWETEFLPEIQQILADWAAFELDTASMPDLVAQLEAMIIARARLWDIHFLVWFPAYTAITLFEECYGDLFGSQAEPDVPAANAQAFDAYRLLQGFDNKTLETTHALWQLSRRALELPAVCQILQDHPTSTIIPALEQSEAGRAFLVDLRIYLDEYGQRSDKWVISSPSWIEDPTPVLKNLKDYITQPDRDLRQEMLKLATEREQRLAALRVRLEHYPQAVVEHFEFLLKAAQAGCILTEDHGFWIDYRGWYPIRRLFLEFGRRFVGNSLLDRPADIFYLTLDELRATALADAGSLPSRRLLVVGRQAELEYFRSIHPPPVLGTLPAVPSDDPVSRTLGKFFGAVPLHQSEPNLLRGSSAGSPGLARGPARVIRTLAEATKLQPGDILVAETTAPPWTPLFATAAAVVTDTGGILSHCAVVAREYAIPAVVGIGTATDTIVDGQLLEVDGAMGTVRILAQSE